MKKLFLVSVVRAVNKQYYSNSHAVLKNGQVEDTVRCCSTGIWIPLGRSHWAEYCFQSSNPLECAEHGSSMWKRAANTKRFLCHSRALSRPVLGALTGGR